MPADLRRRASKQATSENSSEKASSSDSPNSVPPSNPKLKLDKSGLYDAQQVKRLLDDEVIAFMEDQGYEEATLVSNIKILAGTIAVIAALYSHFGPGEFPPNKPTVFACVAIYICCMCLINLASFVFEASAIFVGRLTLRAKQVTRGTLPVCVWVHTTIASKGSSAFRLEIRTAARQTTGSVSVTHPYETYITEEGRFLNDVFRAHLSAALRRVPVSSKKTT